MDGLADGVLESLALGDADAFADGESDAVGVALGDDPLVGDSLVSWVDVAAGGAGGWPT